MRATDRMMFSSRTQDERRPFGYAVAIVVAVAALTLAILARPAAARTKRIGPSPAYEPPAWQWRFPYHGTGIHGTGKDARFVC